MKFTAPTHVSIFRKIALNLWAAPNDPAVYGLLDIDVTDVFTGEGSSPLARVIFSTAKIMKKHKELNSIIRFGRVFERSEVHISVLVNIEENGRADLSYLHLANADQMNLTQIQEKIMQSARQIRERKDKRLQPAFKLIYLLPYFLVRPFLKLYSFLAHDLHLDLRFLKLPKDPFGAVLISNIGSLGIKRGLIPLVPMTKATMMISVGQTTPEPKVVNGEIKIRDVLPVGITFDHRFFDGAHAARMIKDFEFFIHHAE